MFLDDEERPLYRASLGHSINAPYDNHFNFWEFVRAIIGYAIIFAVIWYTT